MFTVSHTGNIVSSVRFCFQDSNYACATQQGTLRKIRACENLQNFCEQEQASTHLIFASNSSKGQILRALSNWMGPFDTHIIGAACLPECYSNFNLVRTGCAVCVITCLETQAGGQEICHMLGKQLKELADYM